MGSSELMVGPPNPENIGAFRSRIRLYLPVILTLLPLSRSPQNREIKSLSQRQSIIGNFTNKFCLELESIVIKESGFLKVSP